MNFQSKFSQYIKWLVLAYIAIGVFLLFQSKLILDFTLSSFLLVGPCVLCTIAYGALTLNKKYIISGIGVAVLYVVSLVVFSPLIMLNEHRDLIGSVEEVEFSSQIEYIDLKQLPTIDKQLAAKLADKKLGEIPSLGSQVTIGDLTLQSIAGQLYYVAPLEHSSLFKWLINNEGTKGYIKVSAINQNDVQLVTELNGQPIHLKYLESAYLFSDLDRAAYIRDMKAGHTDYTFELDDEGNPYWVITRYDNAIGLTEQKAIGVLIIDAQTGESNIYDIENTPKWVDRIQPSGYINNYLNKWGELVHGIFNFSDKDKLKTTPGSKILFNNDKCYYYTGITSVGNDEGLVGIT